MVKVVVQWRRERHSCAGDSWGAGGGDAVRQRICDRLTAGWLMDFTDTSKLRVAIQRQMQIKKN